MKWQQIQAQLVRKAKKAKKRKGITLLVFANLLYFVIGRFEPIRAWAAEVSVSEKILALLIFGFCVWWTERALYRYVRAALASGGVKPTPPWHWVFVMACSAYFFAAASSDSGLIYAGGTLAVLILWKYVARWYGRRLENESARKETNAV